MKGRMGYNINVGCKTYWHNSETYRPNRTITISNRVAWTQKKNISITLGNNCSWSTKII